MPALRSVPFSSDDCPSPLAFAPLRSLCRQDCVSLRVGWEARLSEADGRGRQVSALFEAPPPETLPECRCASHCRAVSADA